MYGWGNWDPEKLRDLHKVTQQVVSAIEIGALAGMISSPFFSCNTRSEEGGPCPQAGEVRDGAWTPGKTARLMQEATEIPPLKQGAGAGARSVEWAASLQ